MTPKGRIPADVAKRARHALGADLLDVARSLGVGSSSYYRFESESGDAPPWLLLALGGLSVTRGGDDAELDALLSLWTGFDEAAKDAIGDEPQ